MLSVDRAASARYRTELDDYFSRAVDDGKLVCRSRDQCRRSIGEMDVLVEGQASHVGSCYAMADDGHPVRILVTPKQVGGSLDHNQGRGHEHISIGERASQVDAAKFGPRPFPRTSHMVGTALALKVLLALDPAGIETLTLDGQPSHVFDCFAMANATLCSRVGTDASGQGSRRMFENCLVHLKRTVEILEPNFVLAQGWSANGWSPSRAVAAALGVPMPPKNSLVVIDSGSSRLAFIAAVHPSRNWSAVSMKTWGELEAVFHNARRAVLVS